ncbi:hypothetical protein OF83DRAFT_1144790 [Amylostereum chailletii]|nr:hypothetical protein OF83DRAFT_1144790 [Amylostereum chailletii]
MKNTEGSHLYEHHHLLPDAHPRVRAERHQAEHRAGLRLGTSASSVLAGLNAPQMSSRIVVVRTCSVARM